MNIAVEVFEILAAVTNHRPRKCGHGFRRYFDRPWGEKFIVRLHQRILIAKRRSANDRSHDSFLIKLTSPLRSSRATLILSRSSVAADNLKSYGDRASKLIFASSLSNQSRRPERW